MDEPIKLIYKYKNNNGKQQYNIYIFIGKLVDEKVINILEKIKSLNLYDTLIQLTDIEIKNLEKIYKEYWYEKFFNNYHINHMKKKINETGLKKNIIDKFGEEWYNFHFIERDLSSKKILYNYESFIKEKYIQFIKKKKKKQYNIQTGGNEDINLDEIDEIYKYSEIEDKKVNETTTLIDKALKEEDKKKEKLKKMIEFNDLQDNNYENSDLKDVYLKNYIKTQYVYKDDTIKILKEKICCSIKNNNKFDKDMYILPSRQYLWSEYYFNNKIEKVMVGQKWMRYNNILEVDIEPNNNIRNYEKLYKNLRLIQLNMSKFGSKIKRVDDDYNIIYDYDDYMTTNEIYMIDIYNELGLSFESINMKNLIDTYVKIYFPKINNDELNTIISFLNKKDNTEINKITNVFNTINNDLRLINEVTNEIDKIKLDNPKIDILKKIYVTHTVINIKLNKIDNITENLDLYKIYDNFIVSEDYPFIHYKSLDDRNIYKIDENSKLNISPKWLTQNIKGIVFKVKIKDSNKYMTINLNINGRIEYKNQWKEEDLKTLQDIIDTYDYIKNLIRKINDENKKINIIIPRNKDFKYAFINIIQHFQLPNNYIINHNKLSDFARFFHPFITLVIEPKKRLSKKNVDVVYSKYGTYLRYKRISQYENSMIIEKRILYFIKNYEFDNRILADEIAKQFNLTKEKALEYVISTVKKYDIIKSRNVLKTLENIPKYKITGIDIEIIGRQKDKNKIKISGVKDKDQLDRILTFLNILLYLYIETYHKKNPKMQKIENKLKLLTNIAKRRNQVMDLETYDKEEIAIKKTINTDKSRLGFKPEKGQNNWTRLCQKKRQPTIYNDKTIQKLINDGYKLNNDGYYEKKGVKAVKLVNNDENIYYHCDTKKTGKYKHVGFLTKSNHPQGLCMPCCFKKDQFLSKNKDFFLNCLGNNKVEKKKEISSDILYILKDTNKLPQNRVCYLSKYLDIFLNQGLKKDIKIIKNYVNLTKDGYFLKFGISYDKNKYLNCISTLFNISIDKIIENIKNVLNKDKKDIIFTSLNNGNIKNQFETKENYIEFLEKSNIDYNDINDILSLPNILYKFGTNIIIFENKTTLKKTKNIEDFVILYNNLENINELLDPKRTNILIVKDNKYYNPIILLNKKNKDTKDFILQKTFFYENNSNNVIYHILKYFGIKNNEEMINDLFNKKTINAKHLYKILITLNNDFHPKYQYINLNNKCIYIITNNNTIIPTIPSGIVYNLKIIENLDEYLLNYENTIKNIESLNKLSKGLIHNIPKKIFVSNNKIIGIFLDSKLNIPIIPEDYNKDKIQLKVKKKQINNLIDKEIYLGKDNIIIDERVKNVNKKKYIEEGYELFRLEFSKFLSDEPKIKDKFNKILDSKIKNKEKDKEIKLLLYKILSSNTYNLYKKFITQQGGNDLIAINDMPNLDNYKIKNFRETCSVNLDKKKCNINSHCSWINNQCKFSLTEEILIEYVNKLSNEILENSLKKQEIFQENYKISNIVNNNLFTERENQLILNSNNFNIKKILSNIFGENIIYNKNADINIQEINAKNPIQEKENFYVQQIIEDNDSIFRAFSNCYFWLKNNLLSVDNRNLGYFSPEIQTKLSNFFKSKVIDWINKDENKNYIKENLKKFIVDNYFDKLLLTETLTNCIIELFILSVIYKLIIFIYNEKNELIYIIDNKKIIQDNFEKYKIPDLVKKNIHIRFNYNNSNIPDSISSIYIK